MSCCKRERGRRGGGERGLVSGGSGRGCRGRRRGHVPLDVTCLLSRLRLLSKALELGAVHLSQSCPTTGN